MMRISGQVALVWQEAVNKHFWYQQLEKTYFKNLLYCLEEKLKF